jgi:ABC-type transport system involved in multi-copper enzyme maturation permease subunit
MNAAVARDVFRQARASGLTAMLLTVSAATALVCATAEFADGGLTLFFRHWRVLEAATPEVGVHYLQFLVAGIIADTFGVLLALVWAAGFLPSFLDPAAMSVLLVKPASRRSLFLGRFLGVVLYVGVQATIFVGVTYTALGLRTGVWSPAYWLCVPLLLVQFTVFFAFTAILAVTTRNTAGCLVGSALFWIVCWAMNYGRHALVSVQPTEATAMLVHTADISYWILPKPADFSLILYDVLDADRFATPLMEFRRLQERGLFLPVWSVLSSLAFAAMILAVAIYEFVHDDY